MELVAQPADDDRVVEEDGVRLYLDADSAAALDHALLDAYVTASTVHLQVLEPSVGEWRPVPPPQFVLHSKSIRTDHR